MPALRKPHRVAVLVPELGLEGSDAPYVAEAGLLLWVACLEVCQRHPELAVHDAESTPLVAQDGHFTPIHARPGAAPGDAFHRPTRRDELIWLELALPRQGAVRLHALARDGKHETFDVLGRNPGEQIHQALERWLAARGLGALPRRFEAAEAGDILAAVRVLAPVLAEQARGFVQREAGGAVIADAAADDRTELRGVALSELDLGDAGSPADGLRGEAARRRIARALAGRLPAALKAPALRLIALALCEDLGDLILAVDPEQPQALFARFRAAPPPGRDPALLRRIIAAAPCWALPYSELAADAGDGAGPAARDGAPTALERLAGAGIAALCRPGQLDVLQTAASRLAEAGDVDEGIRLLERAVALHPESPEAHLALVGLHRRTGRLGAWLAQAQASAALHGCPLDPALPCYPDQIQIDLLVADALFHVGRLDEAIALRAARLEGRAATWPRHARILANWRGDPRLLARCHRRVPARRAGRGRPRRRGRARVVPARARQAARRAGRAARRGALPARRRGVAARGRGAVAGRADAAGARCRGRGGARGPAAVERAARRPRGRARRARRDRRRRAGPPHGTRRRRLRARCREELHRPARARQDHGGRVRSGVARRIYRRHPQPPRDRRPVRRARDRPHELAGDRAGAAGRAARVAGPRRVPGQPLARGGVQRGQRRRASRHRPGRGLRRRPGARALPRRDHRHTAPARGRAAHGRGRGAGADGSPSPRARRSRRPRAARRARSAAPPGRSLARQPVAGRGGAQLRDRRARRRRRRPVRARARHRRGPHPRPRGDRGARRLRRAALRRAPRGLGGGRSGAGRPARDAHRARRRRRVGRRRRGAARRARARDRGRDRPAPHRVLPGRGPERGAVRPRRARADRGRPRARRRGRAERRARCRRRRLARRADRRARRCVERADRPPPRRWPRRGAAVRGAAGRRRGARREARPARGRARSGQHRGPPQPRHRARPAGQAPRCAAPPDPQRARS
ncbi:MAG: tetratricopeptide repeat protein, partial [Deltaproteobacteria bacterium]